MIRTFDELSNSLTDDLAWRKKELTDLRSLIRGTKSVPINRKVLGRCGVTLLYAHWEGFVKNCSRHFLEYLTAQRLRNEEISKNLLTLSMVQSTNVSSETKRVSPFHSITSFFTTEMGERSRFPYRDGLSTESNLSSTVLEEIIWCLGLDFAPFETRKKFMDSRLLARRNHVAHGSHLEIDPDEYDEMREILFEMMNELKNQIENCAIQKRYLAT